MNLTAERIVPALRAIPGLRLVDLLPALRARPDRGLWNEVDRHFSPAGHADAGAVPAGRSPPDPA